MASLVEAWIGGIGRLGRKQQSRSRLSCGFSQEGDREEELMMKMKMKKKNMEEEEEGVVVKERRRSTTISEATVCMLMDRFAPS